MEDKNVAGEVTAKEHPLALLKKIMLEEMRNIQSRLKMLEFYIQSIPLSDKEPINPYLKPILDPYKHYKNNHILSEQDLIDNPHLKYEGCDAGTPVVAEKDSNGLLQVIDIIKEPFSETAVANVVGSGS